MRDFHGAIPFCALTMTKTVNRIIIWEEYIWRAGAVVIANKVPPGLNLEALTKAATERGMEIVNPAVDNSYDDALPVVAQRMGLVYAGQDVWAPLAEVGDSGGLDLGAGVYCCNRPKIDNPRQGLDVLQVCRSSLVGEIKRGAMEDARCEIERWLDSDVGFLSDALVEALGILQLSVYKIHRAKND